MTDYHMLGRQLGKSSWVFDDFRRRLVGARRSVEAEESIARLQAWWDEAAVIDSEAFKRLQIFKCERVMHDIWTWYASDPPPPVHAAPTPLLITAHFTIY